MESVASPAIEAVRAPTRLLVREFEALENGDDFAGAVRWVVGRVVPKLELSNDRFGAADFEAPKGLLELEP